MADLGLAMAALLAAATPPAIVDLHPIALHAGVNRVPGFLVGGGEATIVEAWRGNGNAHGYHVWMVLGGASEGNPVGVVGVEGDKHDPVLATVSDAPFDGERVLSAVRFATGRLDGRRGTFLIEATLDASSSGILADHSTATVRWYRLDHDKDAIGRTTDEFVAIGKVTTTRRYCNADFALRDVAGVALSRGDGANQVDGCFAGG